jgi:hypothetical protein
VIRLIEKSSLSEIKIGQVSANFVHLFEKKTLDPGLRRDDVLRTVGLKIVILAQAGIQSRSSCIS